jgi:predicted ester cyclase
VSIEANKAIIRRYKIDILNSRDVAALDAIVAADYLDHAAFPGQGPGREGLKQRVAYLFDAFDPEWTVHDIVAEGDIVAVRWSHSAVHRGEFLGLEPTGRKFTMRGIDMYRITAGMMSEHWNVVDMFGMYQQLDLLQ